MARLNLDLDFTDDVLSAEFVNHFQVFSHGISNIIQGILFGCPLGMAARKAGNRNGKSFLGGFENHFVTHDSSIGRMPNATELIALYQGRVHSVADGLARIIHQPQCASTRFPGNAEQTGR